MINNYEHKKVWKEYHGIIPKDSSGRSYDIHHIDGDHTNNSIDNLIAVPITTHYEIHLQQGDIIACNMIALRMNKKLFSGYKRPEHSKKMKGIQFTKERTDKIVATRKDRNNYGHSEVSKKIMSEKKIGDKNPNFGKLGENNHRYGKTFNMSEEGKQKISVSKVGKPLSEEHKLRISNTLKNRNK